MRVAVALILALLFGGAAEAQTIVRADQFVFGLTGTPSTLKRILTGAGSPEGVVTAVVNTLYFETGSSLIWQKATGTGNTGWVNALTGVAPAAVAPGAAGTFMRSTGAAWGASTLVLPNAATANRLAYATATNTIGESANLTFNGTDFAVNVDDLFVQGSTGNVGIGTTSPYSEHRLVAAKDYNGNDYGQVAAIGATTATLTMSMGYNTTGDYGFISAVNRGVGYKNIVIAPNGGNVGIGTTGPSVRLAVFSGGAGTAGQVDIGYDATAYYRIGRKDTAGADSGNFQLKPNGGTSVFDVTSGGNVGIGTTGPTKALDVRSEARVWNGTNGLEFTESNGNVSGVIASANTAGNIEFRPNVGGNTAMWIANGGNVGIGTTAPGQKLDVAGGIALGTNTGSANNLAWSPTTPTISSGFGASASVAAGTSASFRLNVGTGGSASAGIVNMQGTAANGWNCFVQNLTAQAANRADQRTVMTVGSTTTVGVQNQTVSTGAALAWTASDILVFICTAY